MKNWLPWTEGDLPGATMQPQSCYIWPGMEVCGCTRGYKAGQLVNGLIYVVKGYDDDKVTLTQHPDYNKDHQDRVKYLESKLEEIQPKMLEIVQLLTEKSRSFEELKGIVGDDMDAEELLPLGFRLCKKGKGKATKEIVEVDQRYQAWAENPTGPATLPDSIVDPTLELPWVDVQLQARLTHASTTRERPCPTRRCG